MSYAQVRTIPIVPNTPRDFHLEHEAAAAFGIDLFMEYAVVGLDWAIFNHGAADLTIAIDGGTPITVHVNGSRGYNNVKYATLKVAATDKYTLMIAGVSIS
ncbi:unnamed protein product [marine sediment metagenome]|uniref:Uncharacterized protein n=1 Tax=marine sediment metagenome TaxID=412755 RepID=X1JVF4_9ZZZZ